MILVKKLKVFHLLCLSKIDRENLFADVLSKKKQLFTKSAKLEFFQRG